MRISHLIAIASLSFAACDSGPLESSSAPAQSGSSVELSGAAGEAHGSDTGKRAVKFEPAPDFSDYNVEIKIEQLMDGDYPGPGASFPGGLKRVTWSSETLSPFVTNGTRHDIGLMFGTDNVQEDPKSIRATWIVNDGGFIATIPAGYNLNSEVTWHYGAGASDTNYNCTRTADDFGCTGGGGAFPGDFPFAFATYNIEADFPLVSLTVETDITDNLGRTVFTDSEYINLYAGCLKSWSWSGNTLVCS